MKRPNILFAFADDWGRYASAYKALEKENSLNHLIETPNFDRVAGEGVLFANAFVPAPTCTPCRSSVLSGRYFWQCGLGAILQGAVWDEEIPSYPLILEDAGYFIGYTYKVWSPGRTVNAPYGAERTRYENQCCFSSFSQTATSLMPENNAKSAKQKLYDEVEENFDLFLDAWSKDQPFCYWFGPTNTHRHWQRGSGKQLWNLEPDDLKGRLPDFLPDVHDVREDVCDYLGECLAVDAGLGIIMKRLEEIGELDNTLIVVSGDHGIPGIPRGKCNLYDLGSEVALAARWPEQIPSGRVVEDFVNIMDLAPTFLDVANAPYPDLMPSKSLLNILTSEKSGQVEADRDHVVLGRERHVAAAREGNLPYPQRSIRTKDFLYIRNFAPDRWPMGDPCGLDDPNAETPDVELLSNDTFAAYPDLDASPTKAWMVHHRADENVKEIFELGFGKFPEEELYDLRIDPCYMTNVVNDDAYQKTRKQLADKLMTVLKENDDPRVCDLDCCFENAPFTNLTN